MTSGLGSRRSFGTFTSREISDLPLRTGRAGLHRLFHKPSNTGLTGAPMEFSMWQIVNRDSRFPFRYTECLRELF
jgi:hypothetical protein